MLAATPAEGYAACCAVIEHMDLRAELPASARRRSSSAAARTPPRRPSTAGDRGGIPGARLELPDAAHLATLEQPAAMTDLVAGHLLT